MHDFNATYDPALIRRADVVKRQGPGAIDYKYQKAAPLKDADVKSSGNTNTKTGNLSDALRFVGARKVAHT